MSETQRLIEVRARELQEELERIYSAFPGIQPHQSVAVKVAADAPRPRTKLHWTQRPENKAKLLKMARKGARTRMKQEAK